jgi:hypothetical protein
MHGKSMYCWRVRRARYAFEGVWLVGFVGGLLRRRLLGGVRVCCGACGFCVSAFAERGQVRAL